MGRQGRKTGGRQERLNPEFEDEHAQKKEGKPLEDSAEPIGLPPAIPDKEQAYREKER